MKRDFKEIIFLAVQLALFYLLPLAAGPTDIMGLVLILLVTAFLLALMMGVMSSERIKFLYPAVVALCFIPTVWIYYNSTALVHALWYLAITAVGIGIGALIRAVVIAIVRKCEKKEA